MEWLTIKWQGNNSLKFDGVVNPIDAKHVYFIISVCQYSTACDAHTKCIPCPAAVVAYNKYMGGVDKGTNHDTTNCFRMKCVKSYKCIFYYMLDVAVTNAHISSHFSPTAI